MLGYIRDRLEKFPHEGIGEFHVYALKLSDRGLLKAVAGLAVHRCILIHFHSGAEPVRLFFELEPGLTIIWAHAGMSEPAEIVGAMFDKHRGLYADTSCREHELLRGDGTITQAWRAVILRHPDRLMIGTDTWVNSQWDNYQDLVALNRRWRAKLPKEVAKRIANKNVAMPFGCKIFRGLLGSR